MHRLRSDIKPDNAFIDHSGRLILGDFGLAVDRLPTATGSCGTLVCGSTLSPPVRSHGCGWLRLDCPVPLLCA
jgi:serine/threonine protein kinase